MPSNGFRFLVSLLSLLSLSSSAINSLYLANSQDSGIPIVQNNGAAPSEVLSLSQEASKRNLNQDDPFSPINKPDQHQNKNSNNSNNNNHHRFHRIKPSTTTHTKQTPLLATKFVLLTTGDQIKLYPFLSSSSASAANKLLLSSSKGDDKLTSSSLIADQLSSEFHYVVKPFQLNTTDQTKLNQFGNSSYVNWLQEQQTNFNIKSNHQQQQNLQASSKNNSDIVKLSRDQPTTRASILPKNADSEELNSDQSAFQGESGWKKPLIVDVDYFIDERFCSVNKNNENIDTEFKDDIINNYESTTSYEPKNDEIPVETRERQSICLVIVWLDANNHFIHFGSIDLSRNPIYQELNKNLIDQSINETININTFIKLDYNQQNQLSSHGQKSALLQLDEFPPIDIYKSLMIISDFESMVQEGDSKRSFGMIVDHRTNALHVAFSDGSGYPNRILSGRLDPNLDWPGSDYQLVGETIHSFNDCPNLANANQELINLIVDEQSAGNRLYYFDKTSSIIYVLKLNKKNFIDSDEPGGFAQATQALVRNIPSDDAHPDSSYQPQHQRSESLANMAPVNNDMKLIGKSKPMGVALNDQDNRIYWLSSSNQVFSCDRAGRDVKLISQLTMRPAIRAPIRMEIFGDKLFIVDSFKWSLIEHDLIDDVQNGLKPTHKVLLVERYGLIGIRFVDLHNPIFQRDYKLSDITEDAEDKIDPFGSLLESSPTCIARDELHTSYFRDNYKYYLLELMILYIAFIIWLSLPCVKRKLKK